MKLNHSIIIAILLIISPAISLAERIEYPIGDVYEGEVRDGWRHGFGKTPSQVAISTRVNGRTIKLMGLGSSPTQMAVSTRVNGRTVNSQEIEL